MRRSDGSNTRGSRRKPPKEVSLTDPEAAWITRKGIDPFFAYDANYLFDNETGIILNAEGTRANRIEEICDNIATRGDEPHEVTNAYYDMQWRLQPIRTLDVPRANAVPCPSEFDTMCTMAERLTQQRDFIRVDFLVSDGRGTWVNSRATMRVGWPILSSTSMISCSVSGGSSDDHCRERSGLSSHATGRGAWVYLIAWRQRN